MKLVLITAVNQYKEQIQVILKNAKVANYSFQDVKGHKDVSSISSQSNWFVGDRFETNSIMFFAFVQKGKTEELFNEIETFNNNLETLSKLHISVLNVEKTN